MTDSTHIPPHPGFVRVGRDKLPKMSAQQRTALVRKGNELFNRGEIGKAKRIFLTVGYTDGIMRLGDYYDSHRKPLEAFRMYWLARDQHKTELMAEKMASVLRIWLQEEGKQEA
jgi:hypothetical protein